jgi:hypothetical protein
MMNIDLYKEFYFFEINRKNELNNAINIPVLILSVIVSIHFFLFSQKMNCSILIFGKVLAVFTFISMIYSVYFLLKSFSNFHKLYEYREMPLMTEVYLYEKGVDKKETFEMFLIEEFSECTTHNFEINKTRTEDLAKAKRGIFYGILLTFLFSIIYILSIL